jgi:hypothetical protein
MALWVLSLAVHFFADAGGGHPGAANLEAACFLLYLGLTLGVQTAVIHRRALPRWDELGPDAGRRLQVQFGQSANAFFGTVFTNFGTGDPGPGTGSGPADGGPEHYDVIDVEEVDDDGPPHLQRPH